MAKTRKYRGSSIKSKNLVELYGISELLNKIEKAGGNVDEACKKAVDASLALVGKDMQLFMAGHKQTGNTAESYEQIAAVINKNSVEAMVGYDTKNGGLPAIFLDVGTPKIKPYYFRYYAVRNNSAELKRIQHETLQEIFRGLT